METQTKQTILLLASSLLLGFGLGTMFQSRVDKKTIEISAQHEAQANGLEDECKAILKDKEAYVWRNYGMPHSVINLQK